MRLAENGALADHLDDYRLPADPARTAAERQAVAERKKKIAGFMARIARAVHYLHEQGIIHRDLKPRNILLDARGEPLVADLGLARRIGDTREEKTGATKEDAAGTRHGAIIGTLGYMSPEQAQGRTDLTGATDIYGLGALLYKLLTDRTPFVGTTDEILAQTADSERVAPFPSVDNPNVGTRSDLESICRKCLVKEPGGRYPTAAALADDLERCAREEETSVRPRSWLERTLRGIVGAVNHKLSVPGLTRWGAIDLWDAALNLLANGALYALIRTDQPPAVLWLILLVFVIAWWWMFLTYLFRSERIEPTERSLGLLWAGVSLANVTLFWIYCPPFSSGRAADLLAYYPPWTVVNGLAFLVVGRLYWGRYYLVGLAHFLVAALMPLRLDLAPLVYGVFVAVCMVYGAWEHILAGRCEKAP
jgi:serine/threonine-protein kinase